MIALSCQGLECDFDGVRALAGVDLEMRAKDFVAIRGGNGAGKTTLLNVVSGQAQLCAGRTPDRTPRILLYGRDITRLSIQQRANLGIIRSFENGSIFGRLSCEDNVAVALRRGSLWVRRRRARGWLDAVGLADRPDMEGGGLSVGQQRRLDLARILARVEDFDGQSLVLLDEPGRGLDADGRAVLVDLLLKHLVGRIATVMVEHDHSLVEQLAARQVWMDEGRVVDGPPHREEPVKFPAAPAAGKLLLFLRGVRAGYGRVEVLHGIDLEVRAGETVRLRGRNGAGKSTMLKVIMGTLSVQEGQVEVMGRVLADPTMRPYNGVGYSPQGGRLVPALTVQDHLALGQAVVRQRGVAGDLGPAFLEAFPELQSRMNQRAAELSSGQRSLLAMGMALATEPTLLIADEPAAGMAPALADRLFAFLAGRWSRPERAALIVEHAEGGLTAREVRLEQGRIV